MAHPVHHRRFRPVARRSERGYILLMLMLFVALLAIGAGAAAPTIAFQVRRDREEELIHRGVQYSRAIRRYVKKTGRYPSRLEDLENTNNIRFLRKRYKDPVTNKDFKLLHVGEVQLTGATGIAGAAALGGGTIPGAAGLTPAQGFSPLGAAGTSLMRGGNPAQGLSGANPGPAGESGQAPRPSKTDSSNPDGAQADRSQGDEAQAEQAQSGTGGEGLSSQVFGGGPIVGVASLSKKQSIREFNHKNHYDKWQFIYDQSMDRGGLITTPAQPALQMAAPLQQQNSGGQNSSLQNSSPQSPNGAGFSNGPQSPPTIQPTEPQPQ